MILQLQRLAFLTVMLALGGSNFAQADDSFTVALNLGSVRAASRMIETQSNALSLNTSKQVTCRSRQR